MNFNLEKTEIFIALKREAFIFFRFAKFLKNIFLFLFILSALMLGFSFFDFAPGHLVAKLLVLFLSLYLFFWNLNLFVKSKIKKPVLAHNIAGAIKNLDNYNLAEFLDFNATKIVFGAINLCKTKKIQINSTALFHSAIRFGKDINVICFRLGLNPQKLQSDLKNYLEKFEKQKIFSYENFSDDFEKVIKTAVEVSAERQIEGISEKEILVALAKHDDFFKKTLVDADLKLEDIENLTLWLGSAEKLSEKISKFWDYENLLRKGSLGKDFSSGYTATLDRFSIDWKKVVSKWRFR